MNRTLLRARIGLAFFLAFVISLLTTLLLVRGAALVAASRELLATLIGSLSTVMVFAVHAIFAKNAEADSAPVPTQPPQAAAKPGVINT